MRTKKPPKNQSQSQPLRIEFPQYASFGTSRTVRSALWFVNNNKLENYALGHLARLQEKYEMPLYAMVFFGSHYHLLNQFPKCNRSAFYRDFNSRLAWGVRSYVPNFPGGQLFARRYSEQVVPNNIDIENQFFYCALQAVSAGLCEYIEDYSGYNSFFDAINGIDREFKVVDWSGYLAHKRYNDEITVEDYTTTYHLKYKRLPGYEHLSQKEYRDLMLQKLEERRIRIVQDLKDKGHVFPSSQALKKVKPGTLAKNPKVSKRYDYRPLILTSCALTKKVFLAEYFSKYAAYKPACRKYLAGDHKVQFPPGTYKPPGPFVPYPA